MAQKELLTALEALIDLLKKDGKQGPAGLLHKVAGEIRETGDLNRAARELSEFRNEGHNEDFSNDEEDLLDDVLDQAAMYVGNRP